MSEVYVLVVKYIDAIDAVEIWDKREDAQRRHDYHISQSPAGLISVKVFHGYPNTNAMQGITF